MESDDIAKESIRRITSMEIAQLSLYKYNAQQELTDLAEMNRLPDISLHKDLLKVSWAIHLHRCESREEVIASVAPFGLTSFEDLIAKERDIQMEVARSFALTSEEIRLRVQNLRDELRRLEKKLTTPLESARDNFDETCNRILTLLYSFTGERYELNLDDAFKQYSGGAHNRPKTKAEWTVKVYREWLIMKRWSTISKLLTYVDGCQLDEERKNILRYLQDLTYELEWTDSNCPKLSKIIDGVINRLSKKFYQLNFNNDKLDMYMKKKVDKLKMLDEKFDVFNKDPIFATRGHYLRRLMGIKRAAYGSRSKTQEINPLASDLKFLVKSLDRARSELYPPFRSTKRSQLYEYDD